MRALTDLKIRSAKPNGNAYTLKDGAGLYLNVKSNGTKQWLFRFYWQGVQKRISLGLYPEIDLQKARSLRQHSQDMLSKGIDPRTGRKKAAAQASITIKNQIILFAEYAEKWKHFKFRKLGLDKHHKRQSTHIQIERYMRLDILPILGDKMLTEINRQDVLQVQRKIEARGAHSIAEKCRSWLKEIFKHAIAEGLIETNPASDLDVLAVPKSPTKHNPFLKVKELPTFLNKLNQYQGDKQTELGIKLLFLTGVRTGELRQATPEQFDLNNALWNIPAENVKQLQKLVRNSHDELPPYIVPLPKQAIRIIEELLSYRFKGQRFLLTHRHNPSLSISENTLNHGLHRLGYKNKLTGHGIRATISTALNEMEYPKDWIEAQLSHSDKDKIRASYNHAQYVEHRRNMMQQWADLLDEWSLVEISQKA